MRHKTRLSTADKSLVRDLIAAMVLSENPSQRTRQAFHRGYVQGVIAATERCQGAHGERIVRVAKRCYRRTNAGAT